MNTYNVSEVFSLPFRTPVPKLLCWLFAILVLLPQALSAQTLQAEKRGDQRCFIIELYLADEGAANSEVRKAVKGFVVDRPGAQLATRVLEDNEKAMGRLQRIAKYYKFAIDEKPVIYACNQVIRKRASAEEYVAELKSALRMVVYTRRGCKRCDDAKAYLPSLLARYPGLKLVYKEISGDWRAQQDLNELVRKYRKAASSTPVFHFCNQLSIGFDSAVTSGRRLQQELDRWSIACPEKTSSLNSPHANSVDTPRFRYVVDTSRQQSTASRTPGSMVREVASQYPFP